MQNRKAILMLAVSPLALTCFQGRKCWRTL